MCKTKTCKSRSLLSRWTKKYGNFKYKSQTYFSSVKQTRWRWGVLIKVSFLFSLSRIFFFHFTHAQSAKEASFVFEENFSFWLEIKFRKYNSVVTQEMSFEIASNFFLIKFFTCEKILSTWRSFLLKIRVVNLILLLIIVSKTRSENSEKALLSWEFPDLDQNQDLDTFNF